MLGTYFTGRTQTRWIQVVAFAVAAVVAVVAACSYDGGLDEVRCVDDADCGEDATCIDDYCIFDDSEPEPMCPDGETECDDLCVDTTADDEHCGQCGHVCEAGTSCEDSECVSVCGEVELFCADQCIDPQHDDDHCGECNHSCGAAETCDEGSCEPDCEPHETICGDTCVDTSVDDLHCGECDAPCGEGQACEDSVCEELICDEEMTPFGGGTGTSEDPYTLCSVAHLQHIHRPGQDSDQYLDAHFELHADIDLEGRTLAPIGRGGEFDAGENSFTETFAGTFDGRGHTIENYRVESTLIATGFFSMVDEEAVITDLHLVDVDVEGTNWVGGLVAVNRGTIDGCTVTGDVIGDREVGGLTGRHRGTITDAASAVSVEGSQRRIGGLVGHQTGGEITDAEAGGEVIGTSDAYAVGGLVGYVSGDDAQIVDAHAVGDVVGTSRVGGLVGVLAGSDGARAIIESSLAAGDVTAGAEGEELFGGLVGEHQGRISTSFATGDVAAADAQWVGGLTGRVQRNGIVFDAYATGDVTGDSRVGGLTGEVSTAGGSGSGELSSSYSIGQVSGSEHVGGLVGRNHGTVENSYWNATTSGLTDSDGGTELDDAQFAEQTSFGGFDFVVIWEMAEERPVLQWESEQ